MNPSEEAENSKEAKQKGSRVSEVLVSLHQVAFLLHFQLED